MYNGDIPVEKTGKEVCDDSIVQKPAGFGIMPQEKMIECFGRIELEVFTCPNLKHESPQIWRVKRKATIGNIPLFIFLLLNLILIRQL